MTGGEHVDFSVHLDRVRLRVTDTDGRLVCSVLLDLEEMVRVSAELAGAMLEAADHREAA